MNLLSRNIFMAVAAIVLSLAGMGRASLVLGNRSNLSGERNLLCSSRYFMFPRDMQPIFVAVFSIFFSIARKYKYAGLLFPKKPKSTAFCGKMSFCMRYDGHPKCFIAHLTAGYSVTGGAINRIKSKLRVEKFFFIADFKTKGNFRNEIPLRNLPTLKTGPAFTRTTSSPSSAWARPSFKSAFASIATIDTSCPRAFSFNAKSLYSPQPFFGNAIEICSMRIFV